MSPDKPQWIAAKTDGDKAEDAIAEFFRTEYGWATFKALGRAEFDLLLQCEVEVKNDLRAAQTGNAAIEVEYRGNPSGIMVSRALWWVIVLGREAVLVKTEALRAFVLGGKYPTTFGGDERASKLILVPVDRLKSIKRATVIPVPEVVA